MSNELRSLLERVAANDPDTAKELRRHIDTLQARREFGLNFERHTPESVALAGRPISIGDKVRFLPPRGGTAAESDATWTVTDIKGPPKNRVARLLDARTKDEATRSLEDLVYVADFRDPIFPGLKRSGDPVLRGGNKPFHTVINAENYHALEALLFTHRGQVDCIYIDPPYNTGARDWKYDNDYVDGEDVYRHSKWLAFMERRLKLAKKLLNLQDSVLIVTIDEHEVHRLRLLLEQTFQEAYIQMVTIVINPKGVAQGRFARVEEYALYCFFGSSHVQATQDDLLSDSTTQRNTRFWKGLLRAGTNANPVDGLGMVYPIFIRPEDASVIGFGRTLRERIAAGEVDGDPNKWLPSGREAAESPEGVTAVWPLRRDGSLGVWQAIPETLGALHKEGMVKAVLRAEGWAISYVPNGVRTKIENGEVAITGYDEQSGTAILTMQRDLTRAKTVWKRARHDAGWHGSVLLRKLLNARVFDFPKSLYATQDALEPVIGHKKDALIVDFFSGSGTTAHAVALINRSDGGTRRSISITNNEVGPKDEVNLQIKGLRPGDAAWESNGIFHKVTVPRISSAMTGIRPDGVPIDLEYENGESASEGFDENVEFFTLTYENPALIELDLAFERIAPLLWMRAGAEGRRINERTDTFDVADTYGVLFDVDASTPFLDAVEKAERIRITYVVTDDETQYQAIASQLPDGIESVRLYESYLRTFQINTERA